MNAFAATAIRRQPIPDSATTRGDPRRGIRIMGRAFGAILLLGLAGAPARVAADQGPTAGTQAAVASGPTAGQRAPAQTDVRTKVTEATAVSPVPVSPPSVQDSLYARIGLDQKPGAQVDFGLAFRDEAGRRITLGEVADGRPVLLALAYYECPMLCTYVLNGLAQGLDHVSLQPGRDYRVAVVSIDPREGPALAAAKKRTYLGRIGRDAGAVEGWRFLTGEEPELAALAASVGFRYAYDHAAGEYAHPAAAIALTPGGLVSRYLPGVEFPPRDLRLGLVEASAGRLGGIADRVFLACYRYNPVTGKYTPYVAGGLRVVGVGAILGLIAGGFLWERKGRRSGGAAGRRPVRGPGLNSPSAAGNGSAGPAAQEPGLVPERESGPGPRRAKAGTKAGRKAGRSARRRRMELLAERILERINGTPAARSAGPAGEAEDAGREPAVAISSAGHRTDRGAGTDGHA